VKYIWCRDAHHPWLVHAYAGGDTAVCGHEVDIERGERAGSIRCASSLAWIREHPEAGEAKPCLSCRPLIDGEGVLLGWARPGYDLG